MDNFFHWHHNMTNKGFLSSSSFEYLFILEVEDDNGS
jgi:hypothetical protein